MKLVDRLIFGTSRLSGGYFARQSRSLIEDCLAAGIRRFDTAPGYGMGAAEGLIGEVTANDPAIAVHTKAGLARPSFPGLRGWAKLVVNTVRPDRRAAWDPLVIDYAGPPPGARHDAAAIAASIARSRALLRRDRLDLLLLHGAEPGDIDHRAWATFEAARDSGIARQIGFAHYGPPRSAAEGLVVQVCPRVSDFETLAQGSRIYHSVRTAAVLAARASGPMAERMRVEQAALGADADDASGQYVAALALLARVQPEAGLVFATTSRTRLGRMLELVSRAELADAPAGRS